MDCQADHFCRIMFQREFNVIASAGNAELLRKKLKIDELERYGEPFTPDFIYEAIRKLPRFASMRVSKHVLYISSVSITNDFLTARTSARRRGIPRLPSGGLARRVCPGGPVFTAS